MSADPAASVLLDVRGLGVRFGAVQVLRDLTFQVARGTTLAVIGPNGSGKTVLFKALIGAIEHEGSVAWAPDTRIGYVPQKLDIERDIPITALDFLHSRTALARLPASAATDAIDMVGISLATARQPIGTLSGGQFQRLLVAFALVGRPTVLLLDEPTAGVDEPGQEQLNELIRRMQRDQQLTVLFISHELSVVYRYATSVLCLGRAGTCLGEPRSILTPELLREMYGSAITFHVHDH